MALLLPGAAESLAAEDNGAGAASSVPIGQITIEGNQRIESETIRSYLSISVGETLNNQTVNRALKSLYNTGLFADVAIRVEGNVLIIRVVENPIINRVSFEGNRKISDQALEAEVQLRPRIVYTRTRVQADVQRIVEIYRRSGRFAAVVEPKIIKLVQNRVDLVFEIDEGALTSIRRINFIGNKRFDDGELRGIVLTRESAWYRFFTSDDTYDPDRLTADRDELRRFYLKEGYADFRVISAVAELTEDRTGFLVTFTVEEGERYKFGKIRIESKLTDVKPDSLMPLLRTAEGDWYDADRVEKSIQALTDSVGNIGYAFIDIAPKVTRNRTEKVIDLNYQIAEGPRVYVDRIDIQGNVRTVDKVIRREFRLAEGDAFNTAKLRRSRDRIRSLGFFDKVDIEAKPGDSPDRSILAVTVQEKATGELSFGAGVSSLDGLLADVSVSEHNLLGHGQDLKVGVTASFKRLEADLSFTEPYFLDKEIAAGFDVFHKRLDLQRQSSYNETTSGFALRMGYALSENLSHSVYYRLSVSNLSNIRDTASVFIRAQEGQSVKSAVGHSLTYDQRDNRADPHSGYFIGGGQEFAGLGGTVKSIQHTVKGGYFFPISDDYVVSFLGRAGHLAGLFGEDTRVNDRFSLGGDSFRGFRPSGLGPRDRLTGDALGGKIFYTGSVELSTPIRLIQDVDLRARVFSDFGSLFDTDDVGPQVVDISSLRASAGLGFSYVSPFGPIRVDLAKAFLKEEFDKTEIFRFSFGTRF